MAARSDRAGVWACLLGKAWYDYGMKKKSASTTLLASRALNPLTGSLKPGGPSRDLKNFSDVYRFAAQKLAGEGDSGSLEDLPVLFLYRHALELAIKAVLIDAGATEASVLMRNHNLAQQMPDLCRVAIRRHLPVSAHFKNWIGRWNDTDPDGIKTRYPTNKSGKPVLMANDRRFHLRPFVSDAEQALDELYELLADMEREQYQKFLIEEGISK